MRKIADALFLFLLAVLIPAQAEVTPGPPDPRVELGLAQVGAWREKAGDIHPAFAKNYPVALVAGGQWRVFAPEGEKGWALAFQGPAKQAVPKGVRAAMPLPFWENRMACVVSPDAFDSAAEIVVVLHEFVHCYEWETVEAKLKEGMEVCREAMARQDYMWELQHPFPYGNAEVRRVYSLWQKELAQGRDARAGHWRSMLRKGLNRLDWEYMTWQEWKEGLARYLENQVRRRFGLPPKLPAADAPFDRVSFYRGGELFIARLAAKEPGLDKDIERLYRRILASGG